MKNISLFLFLATFSQVGFSADYSGTPAEGTKGNWGWSGSSAGTGLGNGIVLAVLFNTADQCSAAEFMILGNDEIESVQLNIDGKKFSSMVTSKTSVLPDGLGVVKYKLTSSALRELKNGSSLSVETDKGTLVTSLSGSALSFNMAYGNCIKTIPGISGGETRQAPSTKNVQIQMPQRAYSQKPDDQYTRSHERQQQQRAADVKYRRDYMNKMRGLAAIPGNRGLGRKAKAEMKLWEQDRAQRNLDRAYYRQ